MVIQTVFYFDHPHHLFSATMEGYTKNSEIPEGNWEKISSLVVQGFIFVYSLVPTIVDAGIFYINLDQLFEKRLFSPIFLIWKIFLSGKFYWLNLDVKFCNAEYRKERARCLSTSGPSLRTGKIMGL